MEPTRPEFVPSPPETGLDFATSKCKQEDISEACPTTPEYHLENPQRLLRVAVEPEAKVTQLAEIAAMKTEGRFWLTTFSVTGTKGKTYSPRLKTIGTKLSCRWPMKPLTTRSGNPTLWSSCWWIGVGPVWVEPAFGRL